MAAPQLTGNADATTSNIFTISVFVKCLLGFCINFFIFPKARVPCGRFGKIRNAAYGGVQKSARKTMLCTEKVLTFTSKREIRSMKTDLFFDMQRIP